MEVRPNTSQSNTHFSTLICHSYLPKQQNPPNEISLELLSGARVSTQMSPGTVFQLPFRQKTFLQRLSDSAGHGVDVEFAVDAANVLIDGVETEI